MVHFVPYVDRGDMPLSYAVHYYSCQGLSDTGHFAQSMMMAGMKFINYLSTLVGP